jgi:HNH endonuclease
MGTTEFWALGAVSDEQLRAGLAALLASGARTEARIVAHLAEVLARKLYLRDGSASAFDYCQTRLALSASEGCRCTARSFLQFHHEQPWARGGQATLENLRMLCAAHNDLLAERDFGATHLAERKAARSGRSERSSAYRS